MKTVKFFTLLLLCTFSMNSLAQDKNGTTEVVQKASKAARKEAKAFKKEGWKVNIGALPLENQLDKAYRIEYGVYGGYVTGEGKSIGESYDAAKMQARVNAIEDLAGKISLQAAAIVDNLKANKQLANEQAASITTTMSKGKQLFTQKLGRLESVIEAYRELDGKKKEVLVRLAIRESDIQEAAKSAVREQLEQNGIKMDKQLDAIISTMK